MSATQRTLRGAACTVRWQPTDGDGQPADPGGVVTVTIARADGTVVAEDETTTAAAVTGSQPANSGERSYVLPAADNLQLDLLTASWSVDGDVFQTTTVDVVGGQLFTIQELLGVEQSVNGSSHSNAAAIAARKEVEEQFETWCRGAFFPSFAVERRDPTTSIVLLSKPNVRAIRSIRRYSTYDVSYVDATETELGLITMPSAAGVFPAPASVWAGPLRVQYEHGLDAPPMRIKRAAMQCARILLDSHLTATPDRANSFVDAAGTTIFLSRPGEDRLTGVDWIDTELNLWRDEFSLPLVG